MRVLYYLKKNGIFKSTSLILLVSVVSFLNLTETKAQVINSYAEVTGIAGTTLSLANVDISSGDNFDIGDEIIIMQMQDDVIGSNTGDDAAFGDLSDISSAGLYEIVTILSRVPAAGTPTSITVSAAFTNTYNIGIC